MNIIHKDCDPILSEDKTLPRNSYIVSYKNEEYIKYDIVQSNSKVEIFDKYWDEYRNVLSIEWTKGVVNPKSYGFEVKEQKKKR